VRERPSLALTHLSLSRVAVVRMHRFEPTEAEIALRGNASKIEPTPTEEHNSRIGV